MPRKPVNEVIEHRISLGQYEREQLDTVVTANAVNRIADPVVALLSDVSALVALTSLLELFGVIDLTGWAWKTARDFAGEGLEFVDGLKAEIDGWVQEVKEDVFPTEGQAKAALQMKIYNALGGPEIMYATGRLEESIPLPPGIRYWLWVETNVKRGIDYLGSEPEVL